GLAASKFAPRVSGRGTAWAGKRFGNASATVSTPARTTFHIEPSDHELQTACHGRAPGTSVDRRARQSHRSVNLSRVRFDRAVAPSRRAPPRLPSPYRSRRHSHRNIMTTELAIFIDANGP